MERKPNHICKACGKAYYACNNCDKNNNWRTVACSPECFIKYMDMVKEARGETETTAVVPEVEQIKAPKVEQTKSVGVVNNNTSNYNNSKKGKKKKNYNSNTYSGNSKK